MVDDSIFSVPKGYKRVDSGFQVMFDMNTQDLGGLSSILYSSGEHQPPQTNPGKDAGKANPETSKNAARISRAVRLRQEGMRPVAR